MTQSEAEALHLEQNLVKRHRPPFNVRLRDDKSFPYIAVTVSDAYPRVMFTRERHRRDTVYFGPYANAKKVRETLDVLNRVFQFRPCEGPKPGRHSGIPCLDFHIERCTAPCIGAISEEDYGAIVEGVIEFLSGETRPIRRALERRMRDAAAEERFEEAARYRNRLRAIESLAQRQAADKQAVGTIDVIGLAVDGDRAAVQLFPLRDGKLVDRFAFHLENVAGQDRATILESFCVEHYGSAPAVPPQVIVPPDVEDTEALAAFLGDLRGARVEVRAPQRGEKRRLAELAEENARLALEHDLSASEQRRQRRVEALEQLRESLNLESLPARIECFDVSNIQGREIVASMSVFVDAESKRAHYRTFAVRGLEGQDDFAAMGQVVARRFARLRDAASPDRHDESFASDPEPRRDRRRQGAARGRARGDPRDVRPPARRGRRAREARGGGVRARALGSGAARAPRPGLATSPACSGRGPPLRARLPPQAPRHPRLRVDLRRPRGDRARATARDPAALRLGRVVPRGVAGGARGRAGPAGADGARGLRAAAQGRARPDAAPTVYGCAHEPDGRRWPVRPASDGPIRLRPAGAGHVRRGAPADGCAGSTARETVVDSERVRLVYRTGSLPHFAFPAEDVGIAAELEPAVDGYVTVPWGSGGDRGSRRTTRSSSTRATRTTGSTC